MKLVDCKAELIQQGEGLDALYKHIETCGRVPYKSGDKSDGTVEGAMAFVDKMIKSNHLAVLEQGTVYLYFPQDVDILVTEKYRNNPYSRVFEVFMMKEKGTYVTTSYRVLVENDWLEDLKYICNPTKYHEKRYTFKVLTSIGVTRELNRHRALSVLEQSTRYCNFSKDKFDNQVSFCKPAWINLNTGRYKMEASDSNMFNPETVGDGYLVPMWDDTLENNFLRSCLNSETAYFQNIKRGQSPQQAREILPLCTATEAVYTGFESDWRHFFDLRFFEITGKVHPNMLELSNKMHDCTVEANIWNNLYSDTSEE